MMIIDRPALCQVDEAVGESGSVQLVPDLDGRQKNRFVTETEGTPMHDQQMSGAKFPKGPDCFGGIHVAALHEPAGFVGADIDDRQIDVIHFADFPEMVKIGGIAGEVNGLAFRHAEQIGAPQGAIGADQGTAHGPVMTWQQGDAGLSLAVFFQPVEPGDRPGASLARLSS
jgi:hypothetical protein